MTLDEDLARLKKINQDRWDTLRLEPHKWQQAKDAAVRIVGAKARYQAVSTLTGVPWPVIGGFHYREADFLWWANLAQGDRYDHVSVHVPRGEGPFPNWEAAAVHALDADDHLGPTSDPRAWHDWSIGGTLVAIEKYNGLGYYRRGRVSPYVFAGTTCYVGGMFPSDGHYDPNEVDPRVGVAPILVAVMQLDASVAQVYGWTIPEHASDNLAAVAAAPTHDTRWVQASLNRLGASIDVDGKFGPATKAALRAFQEGAGILDDGKFGPTTDRFMTQALATLDPQPPTAAAA